MRRMKVKLLLKRGAFLKPWGRAARAQAEPETEEPAAPVSTDLTYLNDEPEPNEPGAPVTSDPTDPQAEPEIGEPVAPV